MEVDEAGGEVIGPTRGQRWTFWIILAFLSAFFAEVISGSYPYPFTTPWGLLSVIPLYGLHTLILASLVFRHARPRFSTLFLAGCIFGMYEAYVTKVLWNPPWGEDVTTVGGVAIVELGVISFCWHPFMAFMVPVVAAVLLTSSDRAMEALPRTLARWLDGRERMVLVSLAVWGGLVMGGQVDLLTALTANPIALLVLGVLFFHFMRETGGDHRFEDLLPAGREVWVLLAALLAYFAISAPFFRPEALPGLGPQLAIVAIYALLFLLLKRTMDVGRADGPARGWRPSIDRLFALQLFVIYSATTVVVSASGIGLVFLFLSWFIWAGVAILCLGFSVKDALGRHSEGAIEVEPVILAGE
jgi:hypothetical protein